MVTVESLFVNICDCCLMYMKVAKLTQYTQVLFTLQLGKLLPFVLGYILL